LGLLERVGRVRDHHETLGAGETAVRPPVQLQLLLVVPPRDQERGRPDRIERVTGEVRAAAARDDSADVSTRHGSG
jgi:hypothetical protein